MNSVSSPKKWAFAVDGVEAFGLFLGKAQGFDGDDLKFRRVDAADDIRGQATTDSIRLNNCQTFFQAPCS